ncbi:uncharacterized protein [Salminus brasiliensis]|uniref:uncharacterized protein isoform X2 n=1 Tax=Salminus brasiliensis TaxID=930266 RepID=UPI003B834612
MLSRNLIIASVAVVFLATTISTAPVEDKEPEENDFEAEEGEEELSEEEEDDDDSKGQHLKGAGAQQATVVPKGPGVTALPGTSLVGQSPNGHKLNGDSAAQTSFGSSSGSSAAAAGSAGGAAGAAGADDTNGNNGKDSQALPSGSSSHGSSVSGQGGSTSGAASAGTVVSAGGHGSSGSKVPGTAGAAHSDSISHGSPSQVSLSHASSGQASSSQVSSQVGSGQTGGLAFVSSEVQSQPAGPEAVAPHTDGSENGESQTIYLGSQIEAPGESGGELPETENNGNGHKQMINGLDNGHTGLDHFIEGTTRVDLTGGFDSFGSSSHLEITGMIDQSSHDFLIGLMGGMGDSFSPDPYTETMGMPSDRTAAPSLMPTCLITDAISADHVGLAFQVESTAAGPAPGHPASSSSAPDTPPDPSGPDRSSAGTGPGASVQSTGPSDNGAHPSSPGDMTGGAAAFELAVHSDPSLMDYTEGAENNGHSDNGAESPDMNGNGRLRPVSDIHRGDPPGTGIHTDPSSPDQQGVAAETQHTAGEQLGLAAHTDAAGALDLKGPTLSPYARITDGAVTDSGTQTDMAGLAGEQVTDGHSQMDITAMSHIIYSSEAPVTSGYEGVGVTEGISNHTDSVLEAGLGFTDASQTHNSVVQTEFPVTGAPMGASSQADAMGTATSEPQGTLGGPSQLGATEQTQPAASAGEQFHTSGQGPEGAENVELEDTC